MNSGNVLFGGATVYGYTVSDLRDDQGAHEREDHSGGQVTPEMRQTTQNSKAVFSDVRYVSGPGLCSTHESCCR